MRRKLPHFLDPLCYIRTLPMSNTTANTLAESFAQVNENHSEVEDALTSTSKVETLAGRIIHLKNHISALQADLSSLENELVMICGHNEEGSRNFNTENYIITTTGKLTRKIVDATAIAGLAPEVLKQEVKLDLRKFKSLATKNPMLYRKVASCIESKPAKTGLTIKIVE